MRMRFRLWWRILRGRSFKLCVFDRCYLEYLDGGVRKHNN